MRTAYSCGECANGDCGAARQGHFGLGRALSSTSTSGDRPPPTQPPHLPSQASPRLPVGMHPLPVDFLRNTDIIQVADGPRRLSHQSTPLSARPPTSAAGSSQIARLLPTQPSARPRSVQLARPAASTRFVTPAPSRLAQTPAPPASTSPSVEQAQVQLSTGKCCTRLGYHMILTELFRRFDSDRTALAPAPNSSSAATNFHHIHPPSRTTGNYSLRARHRPGRRGHVR